MAGAGCLCPFLCPTEKFFGHIAWVGAARDMELLSCGLWTGYCKWGGEG